MNSDPASLDNLRDIIEPATVGWWPLAPGWWVVIGLLTVVASMLAVRSWQQWRANVYRRAALRELQSATGVAAIAEILKRTALCVWPRNQVASLSGQAWCSWLGDTADIEVSETVAHALTHDAFSNSAADTHQLAEFAVNWVKNHRNQTEDRKGRKDK
jgi:hypothetical protein